MSWSFFSFSNEIIIISRLHDKIKSSKFVVTDSKNIRLISNLDPLAKLYELENGKEIIGTHPSKMGYCEK